MRQQTPGKRREPPAPTGGRGGRRSLEDPLLVPPSRRRRIEELHDPIAGLRIPSIEPRSSSNPTLPDRSIPSTELLAQVQGIDAELEEGQNDEEGAVASSPVKEGVPRFVVGKAAQ